MGGKNLSVNLTLSVQWVGMDGFPNTELTAIFLSGHSQNFGSHSFRLDLGLYFYRHQGL